MNQTTIGKADRRTFLLGGIVTLLGAFFAGVTNVVVRYLIPPPPAEKTGSLSIPIAQIPQGGSLIVAYKGSPVILIHSDEGFAAFDAACTHLGCLVKWQPGDKIFYCPCHAGKFDATGKVLSGPPPEPLHKIISFSCESE